jgi:tetratricopeptide (TPR) repeat protein
MDLMVEELKKNRAEGRPAVMLVGAGCSVKAGIPDAQGMVAAIQNQFPGAAEKAAKKAYHSMVAELTVDERRRLLKKYTDQAKINWASIAIALLTKNGFLNRVLTTNYDGVLMRAMTLVDEYPAIYDTAAAPLAWKDAPARTLLVHLHGQEMGAVELNAEKGYRALYDSVEELFDKAGERPWIVVGYQGLHDPVFKRLVEVPRFERGLYWVGLGENEPPKHVLEHLLKRDKGASYIGGHDAETFLVSLAQKLEIFPPEFVSKPYSQLGRALKAVMPFPLPGNAGELNVTDTFEDDLEINIQRFEGGNAGDGGEPGKDRLNREQIRAIFSAQQHLLSGEAERVLEYQDVYNSDPSARMGDLLYWAYVMQGNALKEKLALAKGKDRGELLKKAAAKYQAASEIKPNKAETLFQWAMVLREWAKEEASDSMEKTLAQAAEKLETAVKLQPDWHEAYEALGSIYFARGTIVSDKTSESLFNQSIKVFQAALAIREDLPEALNGLGQAMVALARWKHGGEAVQLFDQAMKKFQAAFNYKPDHHEALTTWADVLTRLAENMDAEEADGLLAEAQEKYKSAIRIHSKGSTAYLGWGKVLWMRGAILSNHTSEGLYAQAIEKFQAALSHQPELAEALCGWGNVLVALGQHKFGREVSQLMTQAMEKFRAAMSLEPGNLDALISWGHALTRLSETREGAEAMEVLGQATEKYQAVLKICPDHAEALNNWGNVYLKMADLENKETHLERAVEKFKAALEAQPEYAEALINLGSVQFRLAQSKKPKEAEALYKEAEKKYQAALSIQPNYPEAYNNWGWILLQKAKRLTGKEAEPMYKQAADVFKQAVDINPEMHEALLNWGVCLMEQAKTKKGINVHPCLVNAKKKLQSAEALAPGSGAYQLARVMALLANETGCREWLEKCKAENSLPDREVWMNENDFLSVRESKWFKTLVPEEEKKEEKPEEVSLEPEEISITEADLEIAGDPKKIP